MASPTIRPYRPDDLDALYDICLRTGAAGQDASELMVDPRLLGDLYAAPYAILEPHLTFVVDDGTGAAMGYIVGALDTVAFEARCEAEWWPAARERHPKEVTTGALDDLFVALLHDRVPHDPATVARYPSHLHIDLLPPFQSGGWGRRLMERLWAALREQGSAGVHLGVARANERAIGFYRHLGFEELADDGFSLTFAMAL